jgi:hypothetical protein
MIAFAAEFPVDPSRITADFLSAVREWIIASPHTKFAIEDFDNFSTSAEMSIESPVEKMESLTCSSAAEQSAAVRYTKLDPSLEWQTTIVFSRTSAEAWIGIRVVCESSHPSSRLPPAKKPVLVRTLMSKLGGGKDGSMFVHSDAIKLHEADVDTAVRCIFGNSGCRLPVVYVSTSFSGEPPVDVDILAAALAGMAHVLVEPSRTFSTSLMSKVNRQNVYGGTIGIYWPDGGGRRAFFFGPAFSSADDLVTGVVSEITSALANRRPMARLTWAAVQESTSRRAIVELKQAGSTEIDKYVVEFDKEMAAKDERLNHAEVEIARLQAELKRYEEKMPVASGIWVDVGSEQDVYVGEISEIVRDALSDCPSRAGKDSRRYDILRAVATANPPSGESKTRRERVKELLRGYRSMDSRIEQGLRELGFDLAEEGKHYKLRYNGDDRYTFTLPKSGSDWRGGLNAASNIGRLFF